MPDINRKLIRRGRTFRVFVSSTFSDMKAERNALQEHVFPRLRDLCLAHGCRFQAIDLRWGVSEEAALDQQTMNLCLGELRRCQKVSPRPNFIVLLGNRYGWQPLPPQVEAAEFEALRTHMTSADEAHLLRWYRRDDNAVPPEYLLLPREHESEFEDHEAWEKEERVLLGILRQAAEDQFPDTTDERRKKYVQSATHQEIEAGALGVKDAEGNPVEGGEQHVVCWFREFRKEELVGKPGDDVMAFADHNPDGTFNEAAWNAQEALKTQLKDSLPAAQVQIEDALWPGTGSYQLGEAALRSMCGFFLVQLTAIIEDEIAKLETITPEEQENEDHRKFAEERARHFTGRGGPDGPLTKIEAYLRTPNGHPLIVHGVSGSGKTSLVAQAWLEVQSSPRESSRLPTTFSRFIGATPGSTQFRHLLEDLCRQISNAYGEPVEIPDDINKLVEHFRTSLSLATAERPLILFLDALDQITDLTRGFPLYWLPRDLPEHTGIVVSMLERPPDAATGAQDPANACYFHARTSFTGATFVPVELLAAHDGVALLDCWLHEAKRTLSDDQRQGILHSFRQNGLPLWLKLAFEEARRWRSFTLAPAALPSGIGELIQRMLNQLITEHHHSPLLVNRALGYLAAARRGLSEDEILEVLALDTSYWIEFKQSARHDPSGGMRQLPVIIWSRLQDDLTAWLSEQSAGHTTLLAFYHRLLREAVEQQFLSGEARPQRHRRLARYFHRQPYFLEPVEDQHNRQSEPPYSARPVQVRKVDELPWHRLQGRQWDELAAMLMNLDFLEAKNEAGLTFDLALDFTAALGEDAMPKEHKERQRLGLLEEALRRDIHFIARHAEDYPQGLFQCLWNSCWWFDCTELAPHYENGKGPPSTLASAQNLSDLLIRWRDEHEAAHPSRAWLRSLRPPPVHLGTGRIAVLRGHDKAVTSVALSSDGQRILSGSLDKTVRVWDAASSAELAVLRGHDSEVRSVVFSPDGRRILSGSLDKTVRVWDAASGTELTVLRGHEGSVTSVAYSPEGRRLLTGSSDQTVRVWDAASGAELAVLRGHDGGVTSVAYTPEGRHILSGCGDCTVWVWDAASGTKQTVLRGHSDGVTSVSCSPDGQRIISGSWDQTVRVWDAANGKELAVLRGHEGWVTSVAYSPDGRHILSGSEDKTVRVWDAASGVDLTVLRHESGVASEALYPNGRCIVSGAWDGTVQVWNKNSGAEFAVLRSHADWVTCVAFSPNGRRILSGAWDETVRVWDAASGLELAVLRGLERVVSNVPIRANSGDFCTLFTTDDFGARVRPDFFHALPGTAPLLRPRRGTSRVAEP